jgi:branched-subunit amino acid transport protein
MSWELIAVLAVITYASRAAALVFLPSLPHRLRIVLDRMPPALFAGLAATSLVDAPAGMAAPEVIGAAAGALVAAPRRSLPLCLAGGLAGYLLVELAMAAWR